MKNTLFFFLLFFPFLILAQDIHFSQFLSSPANLNPALTGFFNGDYRFVANHRSQWSSVTVPYKTFSGSFDMPVKIKQLKHGIIGGGILLNNDKAGDSELQIIQSALALSYIRKIDKDSLQLVSAGFMTELTQRSIDYGKLRFEEQWDGDSYNPALNNGQNFTNNSFTYFDVSAGFNWNLYRPEKHLKVNSGVALYHINEPKQTFMNEKDSRLPVKTLFYGNMQFAIHKHLDLLPAFLFAKQSSYSELLTGTSIKYTFQKNHEQFPFYLGGFLRAKDALLITGGMDYREVHIGLSYDINISGLRTASRRRGGFEVAVIYIVKKFVPLNIKKKICPVYL